MVEFRKKNSRSRTNLVKTGYHYENAKIDHNNNKSPFLLVTILAFFFFFWCGKENRKERNINNLVEENGEEW